MARIERSVLLYCIHYYLFNKADCERKIRRKELRERLGETFHIPKEYKNKVIKELIDYGIICDHEKNWFKIQDLKDSIFA